MTRLLPLVVAAALGGLTAAFVLVPGGDEGQPTAPVAPVSAPRSAPRAAPAASPVDGAAWTAPDEAALDPEAARAARRAWADQTAREAADARLAEVEGSLPPEIAARVRDALDR